MPRTIPLRSGALATVDDADYDRLARFDWDTNAGGYPARQVHTSRGSYWVFLHREVLAAPANVVVDHRDRDILNCVRANLRPASHSENQRNRCGWARSGARRPSRFKGVSWDSSRSLWRARITAGSGQITVGRFSTEEGAARAYDEAARALHGTFACLNFSGEA